MNFDAVHANRLGIGCGLGKGCDDLVDILFTHAVHQHPAVLDLLHRAIRRDAAVGFGAQTTDSTHMPELRGDFAALGVHCIHYFLPAGQRRIAKKLRNIGIAVGRRVIDRRAFGNDQPYTGGRPAAVILDDFRIGHMPRRERTGHGRHDYARRQFQTAQTKRCEQGCCRHAGLHWKKGRWLCGDMRQIRRAEYRRASVRAHYYSSRLFDSRSLNSAQDSRAGATGCPGHAISCAPGPF